MNIKYVRARTNTYVYGLLPSDARDFRSEQAKLLQAAGQEECVHNFGGTVRAQGPSRPLQLEMATMTQTLQRPSQPSRTYDYLYGEKETVIAWSAQFITYHFSCPHTDPVFAVSSEHDHMKESFKAQTSTDRIVRQQ